MSDTAEFSIEELEESCEADLLEIIAELPASARNAWTVLFQRHSKILVFALQKFLSAFPERQTHAKDLVHEIFADIYLGQTTPKSIGDRAEEEQGLYFRNWFVKVGKNRVRDELRKEVPTARVENWDLIESDPHDQESSKTERVQHNEKLVREFLASLKPMQREILTLYWNTKTRTSEKIDSEILEGLANKFNVTTDAIRQQEYRLRKKLRESVGPHIQYVSATKDRKNT